MRIGKWGVVTAATVGVASVLAACGSGSSSGGSGGDIVIGMVNDTSGSASAYSPYVTKGIDLAISEINAKGGVLGKKLKLVSESDGSDTTQTPTLVRKLAHEGAGFILMNSGSASAIAANPVCATNDVVCLSPDNLSATIVQGANATHTYILGPTSDGIGATYAKAIPAAGVHTLAIVADDSSTIGPYVPVLSKPIEAAGVTIVDTEKIPVKATDVSSQIARIQAKHPDGIFVLSSGGQTEALVQTALHSAMPNVKRFSLASIGNQPTTWPLAGQGALDGLVYIASVDSSNPRTATVTAALEKVGVAADAVTGYSLQGYDSVYLIKAALEKAGKADASGLNDALQQVSGYKSSYGRSDYTISFSKDKHVGADGNCGIVLGTFGSNNKPGPAWSVFQPSC